MKGINIVTNDKGEHTGLLIDLAALRKSKKTGYNVRQYIESMEDIEDIIDIEQSTNEPLYEWETVKANLKSKGKLSPNV